MSNISQIDDRPLLSLIIGARNDNYMGDFKWRFSTCLNFLADSLEKIGRSKDVEVVVCDWGSEVPIHNVIELSEVACRMTRFIIVPPKVAKAFQKDSPFPIPIVQNVAIRRAKGAFVAQTDSDVLFTPYSLLSLFRLLDDKDSGSVPFDKMKTLMVASRRHIPYDLQVQRPNLDALQRFIHLNGSFLKCDEFIPGFATPSAMVILHEDTWLECRGYDERLIYWGWMEIDLYLRLTSIFPWIDLANVGVSLYHLEHYPIRSTQTQPRKMNPMDVPRKFRVNDPDWGLSLYQFEEAKSFPKRVQVESAPLSFSKADISKALSSKETLLTVFSKIKDVLPEAQMNLILQSDPGFLASLSAAPPFWNYYNALAWYSLTSKPTTVIAINASRNHGILAIAAACSTSTIYLLDSWTHTTPRFPKPESLSDYLTKLDYKGHVEYLIQGFNQLLKRHLDPPDLIFVDDSEPETLSISQYEQLISLIAPQGVMIVANSRDVDAIERLVASHSDLIFLKNETSFVAYKSPNSNRVESSHHKLNMSVTHSSKNTPNPSKNKGNVTNGQAECSVINSQEDIQGIVDAIARRIADPRPIHFFTIVLNGEPFIRYHIEVLKQLPFEWHWHIVEGVADLKHDTAWSLQFGGRITDELHRDGLSNDGTTEYLDELAEKFPENITIYRKPKGVFWDGKLEMVNAPIENINEECLLWQVDSDELWTRVQLITARQMFLENPQKSAAYYYCHYFVGENLVTTTRDTYGNHTSYEWLRTWRFKPGSRWVAHEPPRLCRELSSGEWEDIGEMARFTHSETESRKLIFQHYAYATEKQLRFKEIYFGYKDAVKQWKVLQEYRRMPIFLRDYFEWVTDVAQVGSVKSLGLVPLAGRNEQGEWVFLNSERFREDRMVYLSPPDFDPYVVSASSVNFHTRTTVRKSERSMKNILVVSHERSGTHLLINTIGKNFPVYSNLELSVIGTPHELRYIFETYYSIEEMRIFKSHHQFYFFGGFWQDLIRHFHVFYVVRDGRDVLNSCFHYYNKHPKIFPFARSNNVSELLRTAPDSGYSLKMASDVAERWTNHVESWMCVKDQITVIKHEDLRLNFTDTVKQISKVLRLDIKGQVVKPSLQKDKSIDPRKGVVGDWRRSFTDKDLRFFDEVASGCMQRLGYYKKQTSDSNIPANVIWIRTDSIGDNILSNSMLPYIRGKYRGAKITAVCQKHIAELYEGCPFVDDIITFDKHRALQDEEYRLSITQQLQAINADIALNSVYSRDSINDLLTINSGAKETIAFSGDTCNVSEKILGKHNQFYTRLLLNKGEHKPELERHRDFLKGLGIDTAQLHPAVWKTSEDDRFAEEFFTENNLRPETTIALFAGVQYNVRFYDKYGAALLKGCKGEDGLTIIALGTDREHGINQQNLDVLDIRTINLCGKTTLRQTAALLKLCRLAFGAETGTAHMACAMGTPNVVLLGGGHFGRFMPYSPLTTVVCLPLECYGCDWNCGYGRVHCVRDIRPEVIAAAIRETLGKTCEIPRFIVQGRSLWNPSHKGPKWKSFEKCLDPENVEIICIGEDGTVSEADAFSRQNETGVESPEKLYQEAQELINSEREEGINALERLLKSYPDYAVAHNDLGVLYFNIGNKDKAIEHYRKAADLDVYNPVFQKNLADFNYVVLGQVEDALEHYAKALSSNPADIDTLLMLGHISISLKKFDEATGFYNEVLKIEPLNSDAREKMDSLRRIEPQDLRKQGSVE